MTTSLTKQKTRNKAFIPWRPAPVRNYENLVGFFGLLMEMDRQDKAAKSLYTNVNK